MEDELIDIVNENNKVIRVENRKTAIEKNLLRRVVHIFIFNKKGELLIQKRSSKLKIGSGLLTSSCSGGLSSGEDYAIAAKRELKEELGIKTELKFFSYFRVKDNTVNTWGALFAGKYNGKFKINKEEVEYVNYFSVELLKTMLKDNPSHFGENFKEAFKIYLENETQ